MPPIDFPGSAGSPFSAPNGFTYTWNGNGWVADSVITNAEEVGYDAFLHGFVITSQAQARAQMNIVNVNGTLTSGIGQYIFSTTDGYTYAENVSPAGPMAFTGTGLYNFGNQTYLGYDSVTSRYIWCDGNGTGFVSTDLTTWTALGVVGTGTFVVAASPTTGTMIATRDPGNARIYRSTDGGATFTDIGNGGDATDKKKVYCAANGNFFLESGPNLYRSTDDGQNWSLVTAISGASTYAAQNYLREDDSGTLVFVQCTNTSVSSGGARTGTPLYSTDNGATWTGVGHTFTGWTPGPTNLGPEAIQNICWADSTSAWYCALYSRSSVASRPCLVFKSTDLQNWAYHGAVGAHPRLEYDFCAGNGFMTFSSKNDTGTNVPTPNWRMAT